MPEPPAAATHRFCPNCGVETSHPARPSARRADTLRRWSSWNRTCSSHLQGRNALYVLRRVAADDGKRQGHEVPELICCAPRRPTNGRPGLGTARNHRREKTPYSLTKSINTKAFYSLFLGPLGLLTSPKPQEQPVTITWTRTPEAAAAAHRRHQEAAAQGGRSQEGPPGRTHR